MNRFTFSPKLFKNWFLILMTVSLFAGGPLAASPTSPLPGENTLPGENVELIESPLVDEIAVQDAVESETTMSFFDLLRQAGSIRYAIFAVFIIGLFLIVLKVFDVSSDKRRSSGLLGNSYQTMNLKEIVSDVSAETSHLMSNISSTLLNVYQTSLNAENLQDEISTFSRIQQEKYNSFAKRVDFLSDTAGALGLLGTVWGMFMVFSSGSLDKDTILAGMGVALLTTLLGLVVSITLNFFSTLIQGYFSGHLENVVQKADELRFRLLEISQDANGKS
jgi:biopolymer transport protein ExbB/TolQ